MHLLWVSTLTIYGDIYVCLLFFSGHLFSQLPPQLSALVFTSSAAAASSLSFSSLLTSFPFDFAFCLAFHFIFICFSLIATYKILLPSPSLSLFPSFFVVVIEASLEYFYFIYLWVFFFFCCWLFCSFLLFCCAVYRNNTLKYFSNCFVFPFLLLFLGRCGLCIKINWLDKRENHKQR